MSRRASIADHPTNVDWKIPLRGKMGEWYEPLDIWRQYSTESVTGGTLDTGHFLAEEAPQGVLDHFFDFYDV